MKRTLSIFFLLFLLPASGLTQERIKFPVGVSSKVLGYGHLWAPWRLKYFEREGLDVEVVLMRGTAPAVQAMIAGSISAGLVANDGPIAAVEQGMDLAMIAASSKITHMLIGGKNYKTYEDLCGATIGASTLTSGTAFVVKGAVEFLAKEFQLTPSLAERGLDYYLTYQAWPPQLEIDMEGLKTVVDIYAEQTGMKGPLPNPEKYVDSSYLKQAWKELGWK
jgi:ABC-type nitrate/sulfonate/bicarbonate transport system substrate-binding protein